MHYLDPQFLINALGIVGVIVITFAESGLFFGFFLPGDSLLFTAGLLASRSLLSLPILLVGAFLAAVLGDNVGYAFGKRIGPSLFSKNDSFFFSKKHIDRSNEFFAKYGKKAIILARFVPVVRTFAPILAGVGHMEHKKFFVYNIIGGLLWTGGMIFGGYAFGSLIPNPDRYILPVILLIIVASLLPGLISLIRSQKK